MMMDPYTLDRIVERDPWETARDRYVELAAQDRPGSPYEFDAREVRRGWPWWLRTSIQLAACAAPVAFLIALIRIAEAMQ
jgi:hypothetical protein